MDLYALLPTRAPSPDSAVDQHSAWLTPVQVGPFRRRWPFAALQESRSYDTEAAAARLREPGEAFAGASFGETDVSLCFEGPAGPRTVRVPFDSMDTVSDGLVVAHFEARETGYLRKPFRRLQRCAASVSRAKVVRLTADNFEGADEAAIRALVHPACWQACCMTLLPEDVRLADALGAHAANPEEWARVVTERLQAGQLVSLSW